MFKTEHYGRTWQSIAAGIPDDHFVRVVRETGAKLTDELLRAEEELIQARLRVRNDPIAFPVKLNIKFIALKSTVAGADAAPTAQACEVFEDLSRRADVHLQRVERIIDEDVAAFNDALHRAGVPAIITGRKSFRHNDH